MLLPLLICFIALDSIQICFKESSSTTLKSTKNSKSNFKISDILLSLSFLSSKLNSNQLHKRLRKRTKKIWLLTIGFAIILLVRLSAHGQIFITTTVPFNDLDQIQTIDSAVEVDYIAVDAVAVNDIKNDTDKLNDHFRNAKINDVNKTKKFNSLSAFLTSCYIIAFNFWLLLYPAKLACDWSFSSITPVFNLLDIRNLFSILLFGLYLLPVLNFIFNKKSIKSRFVVRLCSFLKKLILYFNF